MHLFSGDTDAIQLVSYNPGSIKSGYIVIKKGSTRKILIDGNNGVTHAEYFYCTPDVDNTSAKAVLGADGDTGGYHGSLQLFNNAQTRTIVLDGNGGSASFNGNIAATGNINTGATVTGSNVIANYGGLHVRHPSTPFVDFYHASSATYTSRLIENISGSLYLYTAASAAWGWFHAGGYAVESSKYAKKNIEDISDTEALKLLQLRPVSFDYKNGQTNKRGLIAEEVMKIMPEMVQVPDGYDEDTYQYKEDEFNNVPSIDYSNFVPYLIKMIQIQQKEIDELKDKLK